MGTIVEAPPTSNPRPSRLRSCHICPPSRATSSGMWSSTSPGPKPSARTLLSPDDLKALPKEAFDDLADVLTQVEAEGKWPEGLSGAFVALLPKKDDHGPLAQRPISLLPMVYKLWAAARGAILKEWFAREGHAPAWGQG